MARKISLSADGKHLLVESDYDDAVRLAVKSCRGARWDGRDRVWRVPAEHRSELVARLAPLEFEIDPALTQPTGAGSSAPHPRQANLGLEEGSETLSVSQVAGRISAALTAGFRQPVWVKGEVSSFDKVAGRRHWFFDLVEKSARGDEVAARLSVVVFSSRKQRLLARLRRAPEAIRLRDGLSVRLRGELDFYARSGRTQLVVDDIDPVFSLGELALRRQEIVEALAREDRLGRNERRPWPALPLRVGLITSAQSDAYHDVVRTLEQAGYRFDVLHYPTAVQGPQLERDVCRALTYFRGAGRRRRDRPRVDVLLIVRGGGSRSDLAWFDNLAVARAVADHPLKVLVGVGHERDRSVLDEVAESAKTPTAAAQVLVRRVAAEDDRLAGIARRLVERARRRLDLERQRQRHRLMRVAVGSERALTRHRQGLEQGLGRPLVSGVRAQLRSERSRLAGARRRLGVAALMARLEARLDHLRGLAGRLERAAATRLAAASQHLQAARARLNALDPARTLERGYAIVRDEWGGLVRRVDQVAPGSTLQVWLERGGLRARVIERLDSESGWRGGVERQTERKREQKQHENVDGEGDR